MTTFKNNCGGFFDPRPFTLDPRLVTLDPRPSTKRQTRYKVLFSTTLSRTIMLHLLKVPFSKLTVRCESRFSTRFAILDSCANRESSSTTSYRESSQGSSLAGQKTKDLPMTDSSIILQRHTAVTQHGMVYSRKRLYARNKTKL